MISRNCDLRRNKSNFNRVQRRREVTDIRKHSYERNPPEEGRWDEKKQPTAENCKYRTVKDHKTEEKFRKGYDTYSWDVYKKEKPTEGRKAK
jgi:hypothetical protein